MNAEQFPLYLAGEWLTSSDKLDVYSPYTQEIAFSTYRATEAQIESATQAATEALDETRMLSTQKKYEILDHIVKQLSEQQEEFARVIALEAGKPIQFAKGEVKRAITTFGLARDLVRTSAGELLPLDLRAGLDERMGLVKSFPIGTVLAISPFNFPLNLVAHKLAPAIAVGNPIVLKPASKTPITALMLAKIISETDFPKKALSVLPCSRKLGQKMVEDDRFKLLSFTGSPFVGWQLKRSAGKKKVLLELGGDAAAIVMEDADLKIAAEKTMFGAFAYAGQVCISVQRIIVQENIYEAFKNELKIAYEKLKSGDPMEEETLSGPLIDEKNHDRTLDLINNAKSLGASVLFGGNSLGKNVVEPTVLENVSRDSKFANDEAFAPMVELISVENIDEAIIECNKSKFGLQAGIFTNNQAHIKQAFRDLEVGGVVVNDVPTLRVDNMPYGGIKESGLGREGVKYAMAEMSEYKVMIW